MLPKRKAIKWNENSIEIQNHIKNRDMVWQSKNGKLTEIQDMDRNHIKNCIAKVKREMEEGGSNWREEFTEILKMELIFRKVVKSETLIKLNEQRKKRRVVNNSF